VLRDKISTFNEFLKAILMLGLIIAVALGVLWFGASVWAHFSEGDGSEFPKMPALSKAEYTIEAMTTGDVLLTPRFDTAKSPNDSSKQLYTLHGFYRVIDGKWKFVKDDFPMDEYYWGEITVTKRR